ncbi:Fam3a [Phodopus roborovskii]|uniref:Fam3a protein n=1 Tax=Phodopus roborovskii TaxID=109678 RepID=A0AAU9YXP2_PHORO|nr:Fam3a [Phodopus roborovskii]
MRLAGPLRIVALIIMMGLTWILVTILLGGPGGGLPRIQQFFTSPENSVTAEPRARKYKCGLPQPCPEEHLAFRMVSGAANVIGPKICLEDKMLMSSVKDNVGRGLNIALVNGVSGELLEARAFDMWAGGEWLPQHSIIHFSLKPCLLCLCTRLFKYSFGFTKCRGCRISVWSLCFVTRWP